MLFKSWTEENKNIDEDLSTIGNAFPGEQGEIVKNCFVALLENKSAARAIYLRAEETKEDPKSQIAQLDQKMLSLQKNQLKATAASTSAANVIPAEIPNPAEAKEEKEPRKRKLMNSQLKLAKLILKREKLVKASKVKWANIKEQSAALKRYEKLWKNATKAMGKETTSEVVYKTRRHLRAQADNERGARDDKLKKAEWKEEEKRLLNQVEEYHAKKAQSL